MQTSTRHQISHPVAGRTDAPDIPLHIKNIVDALEAKVPLYGQGNTAARPVSTPGSPGIQGRFYMDTSLTPHILYYDYGTGWDTVGYLAPGSVTATELADLAVTTAKLANLGVTTGKLADLGVTTGKIADLAVTFGKLEAALKPSQGAGGAAEALRALGTAAGQALPGNHFSATPETYTDGGTKSNGQTFGIVAPVAGTYVLRYGAGRFNGASSGSGATLTNNKTAHQVRYSNVGDSAGVVACSVTLTAGETVTITISADSTSNVQDSWATLTRIA